MFLCARNSSRISNRGKITLCVGPNIPKRTKLRNVNDPQRSLLGGLKVFEKSSTSAGQFPLTLVTIALWAGRRIETYGFFLVQFCFYCFVQKFWLNSYCSVLNSLFCYLSLIKFSRMRAAPKLVHMALKSELGQHQSDQHPSIREGENQTSPRRHASGIPEIRIREALDKLGGRLGYVRFSQGYFKQHFQNLRKLFLHKDAHFFLGKHFFGTLQVPYESLVQSVFLI